MVRSSRKFRWCVGRLVEACWVLLMMIAVDGRTLSRGLRLEGPMSRGNLLYSKPWNSKLKPKILWE